MDREIKFRAWHKADKKMYEVYGFSSNQWFVRGKRFPMPPSAINIMQYTGLIDINGTKIFEGDIVHIYDSQSTDEGWNEEVIFHRSCFMAGDENLLINVHFRCEVSGNIYEN